MNGLWSAGHHVYFELFGGLSRKIVLDIAARAELKFMREIAIGAAIGLTPVA